MKLTHIFWSLLLLVILIFSPAIFYRNNSKLGGGAEIFGFYLLILITTTILSPIFVILYWVKVIKRNLLFAFTLLAIFNLYFGAYGTYMILTGQVYRAGPYALKIFILNLVWAVLIIVQLIKARKKSL